MNREDMERKMQEWERFTVTGPEYDRFIAENIGTARHFLDMGNEGMAEIAFSRARDRVQLLSGVSHGRHYGAASWPNGIGGEY